MVYSGNVIKANDTELGALPSSVMNGAKVGGYSASCAIRQRHYCSKALKTPLRSIEIVAELRRFESLPNATMQGHLGAG
jgi:hypothetical protein